MRREDMRGEDIIYDARMRGEDRREEKKRAHDILTESIDILFLFVKSSIKLTSASYSIL